MLSGSNLGGVSACNLTTYMTLNNAGNLGIGTTTPAYKLDVSGVVRVASGILMNQNDNTYIGMNWVDPPCLGMIKKAGYYPHFAFTSNNGVTSQAGGMYFGMLSGLDLSAVSSATLTTMMVLNTAGNLGIGTTTPAYKLDVTGDIRASGEIISTSANSFRMVQGNYGIFGRNDGSDYFMMLTASGSQYGGYNSLRPFRINLASGAVYIGDTAFYVANAGNVGIGTSSPSYKLHVSGDIYATGNVTAYSDARAKSNLDVITEPLNKVAQLTGYTYDMIDNPDLTTKITPRFTGIVAQELEKVLPEAVHKDKDGKYSVAYGNMAGLFVESIKELVKENKELKNKVSSLEERLEALERLIG
jgi:hypothetical protein